MNLVWQKGFTLLEVMVALAILAVVAVTASQASRSYLQSVNTIQQSTLAHFVAKNTLEDLKIQQKTNPQPIHDSQQQIESQGQKWQVTIQTKTTLTPEIQAIEILVAPIDEHGKIHTQLVSLEAIQQKFGK